MKIINEHNSVNDYDDSIKAVDHSNTVSPRTQLNTWVGISLAALKKIFFFFLN